MDSPTSEHLILIARQRVAWRERIAGFAEDIRQDLDDDDLAELAATAVSLIGEGTDLIVASLNALAQAWLETADDAWHPGKPVPMPVTPRTGRAG